MMTPFARPVAALTGLALVALGVWRGLDCPTGTAGPPAPSAGLAQVTIYDPDPQHLWNRLHRALWVRTGRDGKEYGHDRLDPLLWSETKHLLQGNSHEQAVAVLDEFLAEHGEKLVKDPLKRAILQRDLWAVFDWAAEPSANTQEARLQRSPPPRRALQARLARSIQRLALTADEIKGLADNYALAVASRAFPEQQDPGDRERPFLPPDLFQQDGAWVEIQTDNASRVAVSRHVHDFGARSAFRVFLRFPEGRKATVAYFVKLRDFARPWVFTREPGQKQDTLVLSPELPQFLAGTRAALVRQMLLIDKDGGIATTRVTESVQIRVFRAIPKRLTGSGRRRDTPSEQDFYEFTRSRALLFTGKAGGLRPLQRSNKDFSTQLLVLPHDEFELQDNVSFERRMTQPLRSCLGCHDRPGIYSFRTYVGGVYPHGRNYLPDLQENHDPDTEGRLSGMRKREQCSWGLLQGLWAD
ncbi:MAG: hypothetical protein E6K70_23495 [Planctomycetota bacterium]|nr:MAG: hypothetical protein E6K70_23495 [Planctomycetota bacterium]HMC65888.1 hypothetical protein [Gemmataceae bacterium]